jgi:hypothetical protein
MSYSSVHDGMHGFWSHAVHRSVPPGGNALIMVLHRMIQGGAWTCIRVVHMGLLNKTR